MHLQLGEVSTIVVSSPKIAEEVLKTNGLIFANRPLMVSCKKLSYNFTDIAFAPHGNYWAQLRKICTMELLSAKRVQSFGSIREQEVLRLVEEIRSRDGSLVNVSRMVFKMMYGITSRAAFSDKCADTDEFIGVVEETFGMNSGFCLADIFPSVEFLCVFSGLQKKIDELFKRSEKILQKIIDEHKRNRMEVENESYEEDLVDVFLKLQANQSEEFHLSDSNIKAVIWVSIPV